MSLFSFDNASVIVAVDDNIPLLAEVLSVCADVRTFAGRTVVRDDIREADVLFVRSTTRVGGRLLDGTAVRFVGTATAGTDHLDTAWLAQRGIAWTSAAGSNAASVAEYVLYAALEWARRHDRPLREATIGIVGFGHVGRSVHTLARRLGMNTVVNDPPLRAAGFQWPEGCSYAELADLAATADIVTLHVPLVRDGAYPTDRLLSTALLSRMVHGSLLVQASRGGVVDEAALIPLLEQGRLEAAVDVWEHEPVPDVRLVRLCALATPHIAGHSFEGKLRGSAMMAAAFESLAHCRPAVEIIDRAMQSSPSPAVDYADEAGLLELLRDRRCLHEDDAVMRSLLALPADEIAVHFDTRRRRYPLRHETLW